MNPPKPSRSHPWRVGVRKPKHPSRKRISSKQVEYLSKFAARRG